MNPKEAKKKFVLILNSLCYSRDLHRVFSDWLEIVALSMHQLPYHSGDFEKDESFESYEAQYLKCVKPYSKEELIKFREMMMLLLLGHSGSIYSDLLGEIAGECEVLNKHVGQFFTPYTVCQLKAQIVFSNVRELIEERGIITVSDPAVGAGGLLIASADVIQQQGIDPRAHVQFRCTDISRNAFNMAYIQLSMLGLQAVVHYGDTLSLEIWESRPTPQLRFFNQWLEWRRQQQQSERQIKALFAVLNGVRTGSTTLLDLESDRHCDDQSVIAPSTEPAEALFDTAAFSSAVEKNKRNRRSTPDVVLGEQMSIFQS